MVKNKEEIIYATEILIPIYNHKNEWKVYDFL